MLISIHASHAGCDHRHRIVRGGILQFQSTHPMRDATVALLYSISPYRRFQSTHPMRDATATYSECLIKVAKYSPFAQLI